MISTERHGDVPAGLEAHLERALHGLAKRKGVRHAILGVEPADGSYRWVGATGDADGAGAPMEPGTPYFLASVTKLYIGAAVLRLHERGLVDLDEPMTRYLPPELTAGLHRRRGVDRTAEITVRHLLGHATGLREYLVEAPKGGKSLVDRVLEDGDREWSVAEAMEIVRAGRDAHFEPRPFDGVRHTIRYSDTNFQLLIALVEAVTGEPIHQAFEALLYRPLGLTRTFHPGTAPAERAPRPAVMWAEETPTDQIPLAMRSFRDLYSTADETLRFMRALVTGGLFEDPRTARLMTAHWNPLAFAFSPVAPGWPVEYGLAMKRLRIPRLFSPFRPVPQVIGHTGATGSWLFYCPALDLLLTGTVDQFTAAPVPYQVIPRLLTEIQADGGLSSPARSPVEMSNPVPQQGNGRS